MLVKLVANELVDGEIDFVSLVKHGANRSPFKIVKMEDMPEEPRGIKDKLSTMFGKGHPSVAAFFVAAGEEAHYAPLIEKAGFDTKDFERMGKYTVFKQEGFDAESDVSLVALDCNMGLAFDRVIKEFAGVNHVSESGEQVFIPGLHTAMESFATSVWDSMHEAEYFEDATAAIDKNLAAFRKHVDTLLRYMPESVLKMEREVLANHIGGSTLTTDVADIGKTEDEKMTQISEALAGDLAGLNEQEAVDLAKLEKAEAEKAPTVADTAVTADVVFLDADGNEISEEEFDDLDGLGKKMKKNADGELAPVEEDVEKTIHPNASPNSPVVASTSDTGAVSRDEGLPAGYRKKKKMVKTIEEGEVVEKTGIFAINDETDEELFLGFVSKGEEEIEALDAQVEETAADNPFKEIAEPLNLIGKALKDQAATMGEIKDGLTKQSETMESLVKSNEAAIEKAAKTTLVDHGYDLDESLGLMNNHQPVSKSVETEGSIWKGLCPELDALEEKYNGEQ